MTYIVRNIDVLDLKPSTGIGISIPYDGATGLNTTFTSQAAVKSNLINFLLTGKKERVMNPSFGSGLRELMFNPLTDDLVDDIEELVINGINTYFQQVVINDLQVNLLQESSTVNIILNYSILNTNIGDQLEININNAGV
tara:strand:- start:74 stop:493 length:420 start_codon:yes stop_codon:yes gene_type:complete